VADRRDHGRYSRTELWLYVKGRFALDGFVQSRVDRAMPWGTLLVNVSGSLLLGFITGLALFHALNDTPRILLGTGFCGAYTTFSTFVFETTRLKEEAERRTAMFNVAATLLTTTAAAAVGLAIAAAV